MCKKCGGNGILAVVGEVPIVCSCEVGQNAKRENPNWVTEREFESAKEDLKEPK